jgi:3-oxoacyl-[acyl-carrier-protein] synthase-3
MSGIFVAGTGKYVPSQVVTNDDLAKIVETSDEWISERTGIRERRFSNGEQTWYMGKMAAQDALSNANINAQDIDMIIGCTITPDYFTPSLACIIQNEIGAENAFCFDINAACSGFVYSMDIAQKYLASGAADTILVVCSEILSKITDFSDRSTCVLFGDGAGAVVLKRDDNKMFSSFLRSEGKNGEYLLSRTHKTASPYATGKNDSINEKYPLSNGCFVYMSGKDVYRFGTRVMPESLGEACKKAGISPQDLSLIIPHQANIRIVETVAKKLGIDMNKMFMNIDKYANTSCASIPICIDELWKSNKLKRGDKIALCGFGGGLTYGAIVMEW